MSPVITASLTAVIVYSALNLKFKLYNKLYDSRNRLHRLCLFMTLIICLSACVAVFYRLFEGNLKYPYEIPLFYTNAHEQMFDALLKHQLNIDIVPNSMLSRLDNAYDWNERLMYSFDYLWDRVYFDGKYFSYFGLAPVLLVYFPFYFITGKVPAAQTVCFIFSAVAVTAIFFLVIKLCKIFVKKVNLSLLILSIFAAQAGSLILMSQASADQYYISVSSAIAFLALFLLFTFCAYESKSVVKKCLFFALSGISLVFIVLSRPNIALYFLLAVPVCLSALFSKEYTVSEKLKQVFSFAVPVAIGAAFVMWYNYARFGSVFEFGAKYQLTVYDVSKYSFNLSLVLPAFYYYFFQFPEFLNSPPYFNVPFKVLPSIKTYVYLTSTIGIFSMPSVWGFACLPVPLSEKSTDKYKKSVLALSLICIIIMAVFDMCFAGVNIRYLSDIALVAVLFTSVMLLMFCASFDESSNKIKFAVHNLVSILLFLTFVTGCCLIVVNERNNLINLK